MKRSFLENQYHHTLSKYRKFTSRLNKRLRNNTLHELSRRKRNQLLRTIDRLRRQLEALQLRLRHVGVAAGVAAGMMMTEPVGAQTPTKVGTEIHVDSSIDGYNAAVGVAGNGEYIVVWDRDNFGHDLYGQKFTATGSKSGDEFKINSDSTSTILNPEISVNEDGEYVVVWDQDGDIFFRVYDADGSAVTGVTNINQNGNSPVDSRPSVSMNSNGGFMVAWESNEPTNTYEIRAHGYDSEGNGVGSEITVNFYTTSSQREPDVALDDEGNFVIVWKSLNQGGGGSYNIYGRRYSGGSASLEFLVNTGTTSLTQGSPSVAILEDDGDFIVAWYSYHMGYGGFDVYAARFNNNTTIQGGGQFLVNSADNAYQSNTEVAADDNGNYVITWHSYVAATDHDVYGRRFDSDDNPVGSQFVINSHTTNSQKNPAVGVDNGGDFVVVWESYNQNSVSDWSIYAQQFTVQSSPSASVGEFVIDAANANNNQHYGQAISMDNKGNYVVAWAEFDGTSYWSVYASRYYGNGEEESTVFIGSEIHQGDLDVSIADDGSFVVVWEKDEFEIRGAKYDSDGSFETSFQVNTDTGPQQGEPTIAMDSDGNFVVAWRHNTDGIVYREFDSGGNPTSVELQASLNTNGLAQPDIAMNAASDFVITWVDPNGDGSSSGLKAYWSDIGSVGVVFNVNTYTSGSQTNPSVSINDSGEFVISWSSQTPDYNIRAQRYDSNGDPVDSEFQVNTYTSNSQFYPAVSINQFGDFGIVWASSNGQDGDDLGIFGQGFSRDGEFLGPEFQLNSTTNGIQFVPELGMDDNGDFTVVWRHYNSLYYSYEIRGKQYTVQSDPTSKTEDFQVNEYTSNRQQNPSVATDDFGNTVVVWQSYGQDGSNDGIYGKILDADGQVSVSEFKINTTTAYSEQLPDVAVSRDGDFVVVWSDDNDDEIIFQRFSPSASTIGNETTVTSYGHNPAVDMDADGNFVIVWVNTDGNGVGVGARVYSKDGTPVNDEFIANKDTTNGAQNAPDVAVDEDGDFVVVWQNQYGFVQGQRFDVDGNEKGTDFNINTNSGNGDQLYPSVDMDKDGDFVVTWNRYYSNTNRIKARRYASDGSSLGDEFNVSPTSFSSGIRDAKPEITVDKDGDFVIVWSQEYDATKRGAYIQRFSVSGQKEGGAHLVASFNTDYYEEPVIGGDADNDFVVVIQGSDASQSGLFAKFYHALDPNEAPVLSTNNSISVSEGGSIALTSSQLNATDTDSDFLSDIVYTIESVPTNGSFRINNVAASVGNKFTQQNINDGNVTYTHNGSESTSDAMSVSIDDGFNQIGPYSIGFSISGTNDAPVLSNLGLTFLEGSETVFDNTMLDASDVDNTDAQLVFTVTSLPQYGKLTLSEVELAAGGTFTQADIGNGLVKYKHSGSEEGSDSFNFTLSDGNNTSSVQTFIITVTLEDDPPAVTTNEAITLDQGATAVITSDHLLTSDEDTEAGSIVYTIITAPSSGNLTLNGSAVGLNSTFTQSDIDNNLVSFINTSDAFVNDSFVFNVTDGTTTIENQTFNFTINLISSSEAPTDITLSNASIDENNEIGALIGTLSTADPTADDSHTYALIAGDTESFTISGNELRAALAFDFETKASYSIDIQTTDAGNNRFSKNFRIIINDVVDESSSDENVAPTSITLSNKSIPETATQGTVIGRFGTKDPNSGDSFTYELISGGENFNINTNALVLNAALTPEQYAIEVQSTDEGGLSITGNFNITVKSNSEVVQQVEEKVSYGTTTENFRLISMPFENVSVTSVFTELGADLFGETWKVVGYRNGGEFDENRSFEAGVGYWFLALAPTTIEVPASDAANLNNAGEFEMSLTDGWNIIGNPFLDDITDWNAVMTYNYENGYVSREVIGNSGLI